MYVYMNTPTHPHTLLHTLRGVQISTGDVSPVFYMVYVSVCFFSTHVNPLRVPVLDMHLFFPSLVQLFFPSLIYQTL
jgi:hypothetical protein